MSLFILACLPSATKALSHELRAIWHGAHWNPQWATIEKAIARDYGTLGRTVRIQRSRRSGTAPLPPQARHDRLEQWHGHLPEFLYRLYAQGMRPSRDARLRERSAEDMVEGSLTC